MFHNCGGSLDFDGCHFGWLCDALMAQFELPTDDPEYENRERKNDGNASGGGSGSGKRFATVSLPWPFGIFGSASSFSQGVGSGSHGQ
ncbi:hypothetical protein CQW23_14547 [Capsicum baccatum]|uniref:Uncharacterized protein n=1 Tax=Capsicum baccatum TaxID=33114 RepID=A0A2G2WJN8_CAPBA|nr:hypothetical protein CQW23_14547 [Capsicum baccatum]